MYFTNFPITNYLLTPATKNKGAEYVALLDITRNVRFKREVLDNIVLYDFYTMTDTDTIEIVSEELYETPYYHWILMLLNDRYDYIKDLPMPAIAFEDYIEKKYPTEYIENEYGYLNGARGLVVDLQDESGKSIDLDATIPINNTPTPVISASKYDDKLKTNVKLLYNKTTGFMIDKDAVVNYGAIPAIKSVTAYDQEEKSNEEKRRIKIISKEILAAVLRNFRELM